MGKHGTIYWMQLLEVFAKTREIAGNTVDRVCSMLTIRTSQIVQKSVLHFITFFDNSKTRGQHEVGRRSGAGQQQNPFPIDFACIFL